MSTLRETEAGWPTAPQKFCVFCGNFPVGKNREHVIPEWLIEMTGNLDRIGRFGLDFTKRRFVPREFAFDQLVFPSCKNCNDTFSALEAATKPVVCKLLSFQGVDSDDLIKLLDWLDKVRVGLWLGFLYLNKNLPGITPSYHIEKRIGHFDRMVAILRLAKASQGLNFWGPESLRYQLSPTSFALRINDLWLLNASGASLCSRRLGFPHVLATSLHPNGKTELVAQRGADRLMYPVERSHPIPEAISIYQPIFRVLGDCDAAEYLNSDWVSRHTAHFGLGYGKLFLQRDGQIRLYPDASSDWIPSEPLDEWEAVVRTLEWVYGRLTKDCEAGIAIASNKDMRKVMRKQSTLFKTIDDKNLRYVKAQIALIAAHDNASASTS